VLLDEKSGEKVVPNGCIGSRWNNEGKWNLRNEDLRTGKEYAPLLSVIDQKDEIIDISFPYFGASTHSDVQIRKVPVIKCRTAEGEVLCATVFDIMLAHYGVERGTVGQSGGGWAHYVGQEKVRPQSGWATLAFASDWIRPPRHMNTTSYFYMHSDQ